MKVGQYCKRLVASIGPEVDVAAAARLMRDKHVGFLVVTGEDSGRRVPVGVLTDRDIIVEVIARDVDPHKVTVGDVMSRKPIIATEADDLGELLQGMRTAGIRRAPVVDNTGALTGVIAMDDAIELVSGLLSDITGSILNEQRMEWRTRPA